MPIQECTLPDGGGKGWRWGESGTCFADRADAEKQAQAAYANGYAGDSAGLALDRASVRRIDHDGHLFVETAAISAACVSPYRAEEIPDWQSLGLQAGTVYQLLRDPDALEAAAPSFAGKPILMQHKPVNSDDHPHKIVIGAIGNDVRFEAPYLKASLSIWDQDAIDLIQSGEQSDLSCGYYYRCDMTPGVYKDVPYQGKMMSISANHLALVPEGRVPGAFIGDSALPLVTTPIPETTPASTPETGRVSPFSKECTIMAKSAELSRAGLLASGALHAYLPAKMAADAKIDITGILKGVTAKNWNTQKPHIKQALDAALEGKLAAGADIADVSDLLDRIAADAEPDDDDEDEKKRKAKEAAEKLKEAAEDEDDDDDDDKKKKGAEDEDDDDDSAKDEKDDDDDDDDDKKKPAFLKDKKGARDKKGAHDGALKRTPKEPVVSKAAMDAAISSAVAKARRDTEASTIARLRSIQEAEKAVRPYIGELAIAQDSAEAVYKLALDHAEVDLEGVPSAAYAAMVKMLPKPGDVPTVAKARVAMDSKALDANLKRFPGVTALKNR